MIFYLTRIFIASIVIATVSELASLLPRVGALILSLPIISMLAFILTWHQNKNIAVISDLSKETLVLVPLTLVFFIPLALAEQWQIGFWTAFLLGTIFAGLCVSLYFWMRSVGI